MQQAGNEMGSGRVLGQNSAWRESSHCGDNEQVFYIFSYILNSGL